MSVEYLLLEGSRTPPLACLVTSVSSGELPPSSSHSRPVTADSLCMRAQDMGRGFSRARQGWAGRGTLLAWVMGPQSWPCSREERGRRAGSGLGLRARVALKPSLPFCRVAGVAASSEPVSWHSSS